MITSFGTMMTAQQPATQVLDLTTTPPREQQVSGVPGMSMGGIGGQPMPSGYLLPLKIELTSIDPKPVNLVDEFTVEVRLRNMGSSAFFLPASQNGVEVLQHEGKGRRNFNFNIIFEDMKSGRQVPIVAAVAMGSDSINGSLLRIEPGKDLRVLFKSDLRPIAAWLMSDIDRIQIRAGASEWIFDDQRYFIKSRSQPIVSDRTKEIDVRGR